MQQHRASEGFTLIEMLVVLAIIGFTSALAYPELDRIMGGLRLKHARADIVGAVMAARSKALSSGIPVTMKIGMGGTAYTLEDGPSQAIDRGISVAAEPMQIRFFPDGSSTGGVLHITSSSRRSTIIVGRETSSVQDESNDEN